MDKAYAHDYPDGSRYDGEWNNKGQRHGRGKMTFTDGAKYNGQFDNGLSDGKGVMNLADGSR